MENTGMKTKTYKESAYNLVISEDENQVVLYNTIFGSVCSFTREKYSDFYGKTDVPFYCLPNVVINQHFVVPTKVNEKEKLLERTDRFIHSTEPKKLAYVIAPTLACNYNCKYCFEKEYRATDKMDSRVVQKTVEFIKDQVRLCKNIQRIDITWFGGEPCLCMDIIEQISVQLIEFADANNIKYGALMITNGSLLSDEHAALLRDTCRVRRVQISLDGLRERYSAYRSCAEVHFDNVIEHIIRLSKVWCIDLRFNVDRHNAGEIKTLLDHLLSSDMNRDHVSIYFARVKDYSEDGGFALSNEAFAKVRNELMDFVIAQGGRNALNVSLPAINTCGCGLMQNKSCLIGPGGELYRCDHCLGRPDHVIGNIEEGFFHNDADAAFLEMPIPEQCRSCKVFPICGQGCRADILIHNYRINCEEYKAKIIADVQRAIDTGAVNMEHVG
jgi:uncharacterized protein